MRLPRHVRVGPHRYRVRCGKHARKHLERHDLAGQTQAHRLELLVHQGGAATMVAETLLHEVLHACWDLTPLRTMDSDVEESVVAALSPLLFGVLRDNPELVRTLTDA